MSGKFQDRLLLTPPSRERAPWRAEHIGQGFAIALLLSAPLWTLIGWAVWSMF